MIRQEHHRRPLLAVGWLAAALALLALGCGVPDQVENGRTATEQVALASPGDDASDSELPALSVYQLQGEWHDQHGEKRALADLRGRPQVVAMVYTHCGYTCPQIVLDLKRIEAQLDGRDAGFVLVSIDPERDTPERLAHFANAAGLDPRRWTLLTGPDSQTLELAMVLGVSYRPEGESDLSHSNALIVLDEQGRVALRQDGLGQDPARILRALQAF